MWFVRVWCGLHVTDVFPEGKQVRQFFKVPKRFSFNEKQDK